MPTNTLKDQTSGRTSRQQRGAEEPRYVGAGLSSTEAQPRLARYGPNQLAEEAPVSRWKLLLHQFVNPLVYILLIAAVTAFLGEYKDTVVILVAVAIRT